MPSDGGAYGAAVLLEAAVDKAFVGAAQGVIRELFGERLMRKIVFRR